MSRRSEANCARKMQKKKDYIQKATPPPKKKKKGKEKQTNKTCQVAHLSLL
jgi:hypothetical protein